MVSEEQGEQREITERGQARKPAVGHPATHCERQENERGEQADKACQFCRENPGTQQFVYPCRCDVGSRPIEKCIAFRGVERMVDLAALRI